MIENETRRLWPDDADVPGQSESNDKMGNEFYVTLLRLEAHDDTERALKAQAASLAIELGKLLSLMLGCVAGIGAIGLSGGLGNHRGLPARIIITILLCATIYVVLDLDRPHEGFIHVSQGPMLHLDQILKNDPEANP